MSEMVDKAAAAILAYLLEDYNNDGGFVRGDPDSLEDVSLDGHFNLKAIAREAIEAMREPSEAMCTAGDECCGEYGCGVSRMREIFTAQIDTALQD